MPAEGRKRGLYYAAPVPTMFSSVYMSCLREYHNHHMRQAFLMMGKLRPREIEREAKIMQWGAVLNSEPWDPRACAGNCCLEADRTVVKKWMDGWMDWWVDG